MNDFFSPYNNYIYNKVLLQEMLEHKVFSSCKENFGDQVNLIYGDVINIYGAPIDSNKPLKELIDFSSINVMLEKQIKQSLTRYSALIKSLIDLYPVIAEDKITAIHKQVGLDWGKDAKTKFKINTAPDLFKALNEYILEDFSVHNLNSVLVSNDYNLLWRITSMLHNEIWKVIGVDSNYMLHLSFMLKKAFVEEANNDYSLSIKKPSIYETQGILFQLSKTSL